MKTEKKNNLILGKNYIFIFGFPGSGTTIFAKQLSKNINSILWLEPYYIWRKSLKNKIFDNLENSDFSKKIISQIRYDFFDFYNKSKKKFLIEKEPRNILNFLIIKKIFPKSKFIFIRKTKQKDNIKTIKRKINIRKNKNIFTDLKDIIIKLNDQKYLKFMIKILVYEIQNIDRIKEYFNKYFKIKKVRWGIKLKIDNKPFYVDNANKFKIINSLLNKKLEKLDRKSYIIINLEKLAKNFRLEFGKVVKFIGKENFENNINIMDKKRILKL